LAVAAAAAVLWGAAAAAPLVLTSQRVDLDATRGVVQAWQVRLTDGRRVLIAPQLVLDRRAGVGVLSGGVRAAGPEGHLSSRTARIRFTPTLELLAVEAQGDGQLTSSGRRLAADRMQLDVRTGVAVAEGRPAVLTLQEARAAADRVVYATREQKARLGPAARLEAEGAVLEGGEAGFNLQARTAIVEGPVTFRFPAGQGVARQARADFRAGRVDLEGPVRMRWRSSGLEGRRVMVWYRQGRVVVEGPSRMTVEQEDLPRTP